MIHSKMDRLLYWIIPFVPIKTMYALLGVSKYCQNRVREYLTDSRKAFVILGPHVICGMLANKE